MRAKIGLACWLMLACGCKERPTILVPPADVENLSKVGAAYSSALAKNGRPPADEKQAWPFLREQGDPEKLLRSNHDGQSLVVLWGVDYRKLKFSASSPPIVAYERDGKNGKRYVLTTMGVRAMTDAEFAAATFISKKK